MPACDAVIVQVPVLTVLNAPPLVMVQTLVVDELKVTAKPEVEVAVNVGVAPKFCVPGLVKVTVCDATGVMELDDADAAPVPAELVAVTVKV